MSAQIWMASIAPVGSHLQQDRGDTTTSSIDTVDPINRGITRVSTSNHGSNDIPEDLSSAERELVRSSFHCSELTCWLYAIATKLEFLPKSVQVARTPW